MDIVRMDNIKKYYGTGSKIVRALDGVSIEIEKGKFVGIVGPSGSGKYTLLNIMGGLDHPTSGDVMIGGKDISRMNNEELTIFRRRHIGFVFQGYNLRLRHLQMKSSERGWQISKRRQK